MVRRKTRALLSESESEKKNAPSLRYQNWQRGGSCTPIMGPVPGPPPIRMLVHIRPSVSAFHSPARGDQPASALEVPAPCARVHQFNSTARCGRPDNDALHYFLPEFIGRQLGSSRVEQLAERVLRNGTRRPRRKQERNKHGCERHGFSPPVTIEALSVSFY